MSFRRSLHFTNPLAVSIIFKTLQVLENVNIILMINNICCKKVAHLIFFIFQLPSSSKCNSALPAFLFTHNQRSLANISYLHGNIVFSQSTSMLKSYLNSSTKEWKMQATFPHRQVARKLDNFSFFYYQHYFLNKDSRTAQLACEKQQPKGIRKNQSTPPPISNGKIANVYLCQFCRGEMKLFILDEALRRGPKSHFNTLLPPLIHLCRLYTRST